MQTFHFLHGFLGLPSDWETFEFESHAKNKKFFFHALEDFVIPQTRVIPRESAGSSLDPAVKPRDEMNRRNDNRLDQRIHPQNLCAQWADKFNQKIVAASTTTETKKSDLILVGYSLGGRLALHSLIQDTQNIWSGAIIISAHPGLSTHAECEQRIANDQRWSERFLNESWTTLLEDWNRQGVFSAANFERKEKNYNREILSHMLMSFSLGTQENLRHPISKLTIPILWLTGEHDIKFSVLGKEISQLNPNIHHKMISNAAHRVPWDNPKEFCEIFQSFEINHVKKY